MRTAKMGPIEAMRWRVYNLAFRLVGKTQAWPHLQWLYYG